MKGRRDWGCLRGAAAAAAAAAEEEEVEEVAAAAAEKSLAEGESRGGGRRARAPERWLLEKWSGGRGGGGREEDERQRPRVPVPSMGKQTMDYDFKAWLARSGAGAEVEDLFEYEGSAKWDAAPTGTSTGEGEKMGKSREREEGLLGSSLARALARGWVEAQSGPCPGWGRGGGGLGAASRGRLSGTRVLPDPNSRPSNSRGAAWLGA